MVKVFLEEITPGLNVKSTGMVTDFKHLGWFKNFLDDTLDHKLILDIADPLIEEEANYLLDDDGNLDLKSYCHYMPEGYWIPDLTKIKETLDRYIQKYNFDKNKAKAIFEKYEGMVLVDFVPTSENLAMWLAEVTSEKMKGIPNVKVHAVEYWETPKSHCRVEV